MKKLLGLILLFILTLYSNNLFAENNTSNNQQYYEIDFTYQNIINGKAYTEEAVLLRDKTWLQQNNITKAGDTMVLNIPEFGVVNAKATAKEVKSTKLNPASSCTNNQSMVTGTFKHYSSDVREYTLQDSKTGITQDIQATPNHAFYVQNRTAYNKALKQNSHFIEIQDITPKDHMLNEAGNNVELVCNNNVCGKQLVKNNKPIAVYNLEIFKQHQYLVVSNNSINQKKNNNSLLIAVNKAILVHNVCSGVVPGQEERWKELMPYSDSEEEGDTLHEQIQEKANNVLNKVMNQVTISSTGIDDNFPLNPLNNRLHTYREHGYNYNYSFDKIDRTLINRASYLDDLEDNINEDDEDFIEGTADFYENSPHEIAGNCNEQASCTTIWLRDEFNNNRINIRKNEFPVNYIFNEENIDDVHVFSTIHVDNIPYYIVDPWLGAAFPYSQARNYYGNFWPH